MNEAERQFQYTLTNALYESLGDDGVADIRTFSYEGVLTMNAGLVLRMEDGSEFQLTIVQSERAR